MKNLAKKLIYIHLEKLMNSCLLMHDLADEDDTHEYEGETIELPENYHELEYTLQHELQRILFQLEDTIK